MTSDDTGPARPAGGDAPLPRLVAVAASAGGVEALKVLVGGLPPDLPAAVLVALHLPRDARSVLADILGRAGRRPVRVAADGLRPEAGEVLVAPPDRHLLVRDGCVVLGTGPRENGHRPSHDAMLRSVAVAGGPDTIGVVLTGLLDDGAAGLAAVHRYGGSCLVQDPADSEFASMPRAALTAVPSARSLRLSALAEEVVRLVAGPSQPPQDVDPEQRRLDLVELDSAQSGSPVMPDGSLVGAPSPFACPDCHGVLNEVPDAEVLRFRCRTGHAWTSASLVAQQEEQVEEALWVALRVLEERVDLSRRLAEDALSQGRAWSAEQFTARAGEADRSASLIRGVLAQELSSAERVAPVAAP